MEFDEYQKRAGETYTPQAKVMGHIYTTLGLVGEAGEVAEKVKKIIRDDGNVITDERRELLKKEIGDVLWYISQLSADLGLSLDDVATHNLEKLASRKERGEITGDGDTR